MKRAILRAIRFYQASVSPLFPPPLPVYPHLLGIRPAGSGEIRAAAGRLYGVAALSAMQSLPQRRV